MRSPFLAFSLFSGLAIAACGGATVASSTTTPVTRSPECPATLPVSGEACPSSVNLECEYGTDIHCTQIAVCNVSAVPVGGATPVGSDALTWFVQPSDPSCSGNSAVCAASFAKVVEGTACTQGASCTYPEGRCACAGCLDNASGVQAGQWVCEAWETPTGCPADRPLIGTACSTDGEECDYGPNCCAEVNIGPAMKCTAGFWAGATENCACGGGVALCGQE